MEQQKWSVESVDKKLHQARIGNDVKESIQTLSIINGDSISDTTEELLRIGIESNGDKIQKYHHDRLRGF
tara:strand:+ start:121 stop:330 length:210 start_codon:yes stop_codon:yes gene_type:complete